MLTRGYSGTRAYCQSKLAQIMFTIDLGAALEGTGVTVTCLHPATYMDTSMVRRAGVRPLSTVEEGARAILNLATSPAVEGQTGLYFNGLHEAKAQSQAYDLDARRQLQALSLELTGLSAQGGDPGEAGRAFAEWEHEGGMSSALCTLCVVAQPERDDTPFANTNLGLEFPEIRLSKSKTRQSDHS